MNGLSFLTPDGAGEWNHRQHHRSRTPAARRTHLSRDRACRSDRARSAWRPHRRRSDDRISRSAGDPPARRPEAARGTDRQRRRGSACQGTGRLSREGVGDSSTSTSSTGAPSTTTSDGSEPKERRTETFWSSRNGPTRLSAEPYYQLHREATAVARKFITDRETAGCGQGVHRDRARASDPGHSLRQPRLPQAPGLPRRLPGHALLLQQELRGRFGLRQGLSPHRDRAPAGATASAPARTSSWS